MESVLGYGSILLFGATALASLRRWRRERSEASRWAFLAFTCIALVEASQILDVTGISGGPWVQKATIGVLILFPYFLFRFAGSFGESSGTIDRLAGVATTAMLLITLVISVPDGEGSRPAWVLGYLLSLLVLWTALTTATVKRIWPAKGLPAVARKRMQFLASAAVGFNLAILVALFGSRGGLEAIVATLALLSGGAFYVAISPPFFVRELWRRPEQRNLQTAMQELMGAHTKADVAAVLLPAAAAMVGGMGARLVDDDGETIGSFGDIAIGGTIERIVLGADVGALEIQTDRFTPYFGPEELELLRSIGALAAVAIERAEMFEDEQLAKTTLEGFNKKLQKRNEDLSREIGERRRAEEELVVAREESDRANMAKSEFLSRMSHELRTPLNSILGFGQLMQLDELNPEQEEGVGYILKAGRHLLDLINEILDVSRIEAGNMTLSMEPIPVDDAIEEAISLIRPIAQRRDISVSTSPAAMRGLHVLADRQRLKQVLLNLLGNAVKYNRQGGNIAVSAESDDGSLRIKVRDEGFGISDERMSQLFEPFDRMGAETTSIEGTGLGLPLSKGLVELMGGQMSVQTVLEHGSTFSIEFPIVKGPVDSVPISTSARAFEKGPTLRTILYIEDNLSNLKLIEHLLGRRDDVRLLTAMQAKLGLELAREHRPDIVLLDLHLPDMSGEEALRELRHDPLTRGISVIVVSADATSGQIKRLLASGADAYLTKPLNVRHFEDVLEEQMARSVA
jgi:signal transduction histidine kinase/ActR/RegA family two-component response regulator